jgi:hypothetical protein
MLRLTVSQCLGVKFTLGLVTRYYFLSKSCWVVSVGLPLWREVGPVSCHSLSAVFSPVFSLSLSLSRMTAGPRYERTVQKTLRTVLLLLPATFTAITWGLLNHCPARGVLTDPFPSNGCPCWPQYYSH